MNIDDEGNGAHKKLTEYFELYGRPAGHTPQEQATLLLTWLAIEGYRVDYNPFEGDEEDGLPDTATVDPTPGATIYPFKLFHKRPHP